MAFHSWSLALELAWNWGDSQRNKGKAHHGDGVVSVSG